MVLENTHPIYKESLRPYSVLTEAVELMGDESGGNIMFLNGLMSRMREMPDRNVGTALELRNIDEPGLDRLDGDDLRSERAHRMEVNLSMLEKLYETYGVTDSSLLVEQEENELWLTLVHNTSNGFTFRELWGYAPGHTAGDFAPDCFCVMAEAIRDPGSDDIHFR